MEFQLGLGHVSLSVLPMSWLSPSSLDPARSRLGPPGKLRRANRRRRSREAPWMLGCVGSCTSAVRQLLSGITQNRRVLVFVTSC